MDHCLIHGPAQRRPRRVWAPLAPLASLLAPLLAACTYAPERTIPDPLPEVLAWALTERPAGAYFGLDLAENDSGSLEDLAFAPGLRVVKIAPNSPGEQAGFRVDDVLLSADGKELFAPADVEALLGAVQGDTRLTFDVQRGDTVFEVPVALAAAAPDAAVGQPQFHLDPVRSRAAWGDAPLGGPRGALLVSRPDEGPVRKVPIGTVITGIDETTVLSGRGLVRELAGYVPSSEVTLHGTTPDGEARDFVVRLLGEGRIVTRASVPVLFTYDADLEADRRSFVLIDLWVISLIRYERDGNERRWRFLRFFEWSSGVGARRVMLALLSLCALALPQESHYVDASLPVEGTLLAAEFVDVDRDGRNEVVLAVRTPAGAREIRIHDTTPEGVSRAPRRTIRVLEDVVAWTMADVREEPGRELVLLTRSGAFAMDPNVEQLRGNIRRLIDTPLLYDVPNPLALPYWAYVVSRDQREELLLPDRNGFAIYTPGATPEAEWTHRAAWPAGGGEVAKDPDDSEGRKRELERDQQRNEARFEVTVGEGMMPFVGEPSVTTLASDGRSMRAPALVDIDGDGRRDLLLLIENQLRIHIAGAAGIPAAPTRTEDLPEYLRRGDRPSSLRLVDLDGDGRLDILATWNAELESFENVEWRVFVLLSRPDRLFPVEPNQVLRFEAAAVRIDVGLIDDDKRPDLVVRTFVLPSKLAAATGLVFEHSHLLYRGERGGLERKPTLRQARTFDENGVREVLANRRMAFDCSGDGLADLVEVGLDGRIVIKRLRKESGFLSATKWLLDDAPWKSYATRGSVLSLEVEDLNGDGLGDIVSRGENGLTVLLSKRGRAR